MKQLELINNEGNVELIDQLGFGTAGIGDYKKTKEVILQALKTGYRRFDTASMYENEAAIGDAIKTSDISRNELFITTKLWNGGNFSYQDTIIECQKSLKRLNLEYVDLYLHHWPAKKRLESWKAMEKLLEEGLTRYIGVSNYMIQHLDQLRNSAEIPPVINQVEFNPFLFQKELLNYCTKKNIILEAYSPLAQAKKLDHDAVVTIANKYNKTPAQILLRWGIDLNISVIPKSSSIGHIMQNFNIFDFQLDTTDMEQLSALNENLRLEWDPSKVA